MTFGLPHPLLTTTVAIVLGCLLWRYRWYLSNRKKPHSSNIVEEHLIPDQNSANTTNIGSEPLITTNVTDLNYPSPLEKYVEPDRRILCKYTWTSYKSLPPTIQEPVELAVLKDILATFCEVSLDACAACLKDNQNVRTLLLKGWERGTFEALRIDEEFLSLSKRPRHRGSERTFQPSGETESDISNVEPNSIATGGIILSSSQPHSEVAEMTSSQRLVPKENEDEEDTEREESIYNEDMPINGMLEHPEYNDDNFGIFQSQFTAGRDINVAVSIWKPIHTSGEDREIATWFFDVVDYRTIHNEIAKKRSKSTGGWLLRSKTYQEWCESPQQRLMWCPGIPGVGKTVMASLVIDHLRTFDEAHTFVGFIYFNYKLRSQQSRLAVLEALCRQAFETYQKPEVKQYLMELYNLHQKRKSRPTDTELQSTLSKIFQHYSGCYIILDALDEYTAEYSDKKVREMISDILSLGSNVKLLITSRVLGEMSTTFRELGASREEIKGDNGDMRVYLGERVATLKLNLDFEVSDEFSEHIVAKVIEAAKGRFLVAELGMNLLAEQFNLGELEDALNKLPDEIDDTYVRVIELINTYPESRRELAMNALKWVAYANRPLYVCEIQHALATKHGREEINKYVTPLSTITSLCAGLIVVPGDERNDGSQPCDYRIIQFVHFTTQEFFEKMQSKYFCNSHQEMFLTCIEYLSITGNYSLPADFFWDPLDYLEEVHQFPFYDYSALHWGHHANTHHNSLHKEVENFLLRNDRVLELSWDYTLKASFYGNNLSYGNNDMGTSEGSGIFLAVWHNQFNTLPQLCCQMHTFPRTMKGRTPLHIAALNRWPPLPGTTLADRSPTVKVLLEHGGTEVDTEDDQGRTPFSYATGYVNIPIVKLLLEHGGIDVDTKDNEGWTPLSWAVKNGDELIVKLLLEHGGVDVNAEDNDGGTALSSAAGSRYGREPIFKLLLEHRGVEVNAKNRFGMTPLSCAAANGNEPIVKLLLEHRGVEVDLADNDGRTPLSYAAHYGKESIVKLLLEHEGVDVDAKDNEGCTPLSYAAMSGRQLIVQLLLEHGGVDVDTKANDGRTPFSYATESGREPVVKLLLEHGGVEVDLADNYGRTPLSYAADRGSEPIVKLLLEHGGVEVDTKNIWGWTPLFYAAHSGNEPIVKLLLEHGGVEVDTKDNNGGTPLTYAAQYGREPIVKLLLEYGGIEVDTKDNNGGTPLFYAAQYGNKPIVELLLEHGGVEVNTKDNNGGTPLSYAAQYGNKPIVKLLLEHEGVEVDTKDNNGGTPLSYAAQYGNKPIVELLLEHGGVEVNTKDNNGGTPLFYAARNGNEPIVKLLLEHGGVEVDLADNDGRTPLSYAAQYGREPIVKLLLEHGGVEVDTKDNNGQTPLSYAAQHGLVPIVKLLLEHRGVVLDADVKYLCYT